MSSPLPLLVVIVAIVALAATGNLVTTAPAVIAVQVAAVALSIWARRSFDAGSFRVTAAPGGTSVIRRGPYRWIRHPMYAAALLFVWAAVLSHRSVLTFAIGIVVTVVVATRIVVEERLLRATYPDYDNYARSTRAVVPFVL